eukprot:CAMPEP_0169279966 /NCGR_PEP_ID=MMETSP1016-20121227/55317_1 /TAXON_ID=342587 /ORGANISM="Karlodinium micrum, Strain CCMP2283" /LENGTH=38 /DNA_ID= /DNA_START= /DNA_END= /DNA_ORIENTATION=
MAYVYLARGDLWNADALREMLACLRKASTSLAVVAARA